MSIATPKTKWSRRRLQSQGSFSLIETVIALSLVAFLIVEVAAVQGNSIVFSDYGRNITQASWLANRVMSRVEYYSKIKPFKELETNITDGTFDDGASPAPCAVMSPDECRERYTYSLEIKEWKFPFIQLLQSTLGGGPSEGDEDKEDTKEDASGGMGKMLETVIEQVFGKEPIFLTAHVEVYWPDGAARNSTGLTYLLTNQVKLDEAIVQLKPVWDKLTKPPTKKDDKKGTGGNPNSGTDPTQPQPTPVPPPP
jgi:hypothetical protein